MRLYATLIAALLATVVSAAGQPVPTFLTPVTYPVPNAAMVAVGDFNRDGLTDIVTANGFQGVSLLLRNADATFQPARELIDLGPNHPSYTYVAVGDFNNDRKLDIAVAKGDSTFSVLLGNGDGTFQAAIDTPVTSITQLVVGDFNKDGKLDLAVDESIIANNLLQTNIVLLLGNGNGTFTRGFQTPGSKVLVADLNGDGKQDLYVFGSSTQTTMVSYIKMGNGDGTFFDGQQNPVAAVPGALTAILADLNGDGKRDLITYSSYAPRNQLKDNVLIAIAVGDGTFVPQASQFNTFGFLEGANPLAIDFNHDGKVDLAAPSAVVPGNGDGTFTELSGIPGAFPPPTGGFAVSCRACFVAADLGHHGALDLIFAANNVVSVARNTGGNPPLLAQLTLGAISTVGGTSLAATVSLGGPAPAGGAVVALSSDNAAAFLPDGPTVTIPAGSSTAPFTVSTSAVAVGTPVTISASWKGSAVAMKLTVVPPFTLTSISFAPSSILGMFPSSVASGFVNMSGPVSDGVVVTLTSSNPAAVSVPATVPIGPGFDNGGFVVSAMHVDAVTPVTITASYQGVSKSAVFTDLKGTDSVVITLAQYVVRSGGLKIEGTATDLTAKLQVFNAATKASLGFATFGSGNKFTFQATAGGGVTSVAVQSDKGGLAIAPAAQK